MQNRNTGETPGSTINLRITETDRREFTPETWMLITWVLYSVILVLLSITAFMCVLIATLV